MFQANSQPSGRIKPLSTIVEEYLGLEAQERQRSVLKASNPIALTIYGALDSHAGIREDGLQRPAEGRVGAEDGSGIDVAFDRRRDTPIDVGVQGRTSFMPTDGQFQGKGPSMARSAEEIDRSKTTPRRNLTRKGTPRKRKRIDGAQENILQSPTHWNGDYNPLDLPENLRDCQMNLEGLEELLVDSTKQNQFAQGLLQLLNQQHPNNVDALDSNQEPGFHEEDFEWLFSLAEPSKKTPALPADASQAREAGKVANGRSKELFPDLNMSINQLGEQLNPYQRGVETKANSIQEREIPEEIAEFMSRPEDFADVIDACIS